MSTSSNAAAANKANGSSSSSSNNMSSRSAAGNALLVNDAIWDMPPNLLQEWILKSAPLDKDPAKATEMWKNLETALNSLYEEERPVQEESSAMNDDDDDDGNNSKRKKKKRKQTMRVLHDPYHLWLQAWKDNEDNEDKKKKEDTAAPVATGDNRPPPVNAQQPPAPPKDTMVLSPEADDVPSSAGGKVAHLTLGGIINALALKPGGVVQKVTPPAGNAKSGITPNYIPSTRLHRAVEARVHADILRTTPLRIQDMLAPDLSLSEMNAIRKRIYDTVILGKGMHTNDPNDEDDLVVAVAPTGASSSGGGSALDAYQKCNICNNNDQSLFVLDRKNGDVICSNCGTVVSESIMHEGSQFRKFEGEADRNHHGDAANPLYSNAHNMSTTLGGMSMGMVRGGIGSGKRSNLETILRNAHAYTELNVSQFGKTDRRTRVGYKDKQKKGAFVQMTHVGDALSLHEAVVQRAKELFAGFRDDRELVQQFKGVIAACLCEAFEQLSQEGKAILKRDAEQQVEEAANQPSAGAGPGAPARPISARAARRNELHHATLAGKGGLLIDFSNLNKDLDKGGEAATAGFANGNGGGATSAATSPKATEKAAAAWNLLDCRSWLLDASRRIAQQWTDERNKADNPATVKNIPSGTLEELEGKLVEHSIALCEHLELELQSHQNKNAGLAATAAATAAAKPYNGIKKRVTTPRVQDMSKLGIKWQHSHERGSGGKGGVGGSGHGHKRKLAAGPGGARSGPGRGGRTAGQILLLKTAKKLGSILNDEVAGAAFHKELREVIGQQETRKRQLMREEATRQRLQQMKRKPWLQARLQA